MMQNFVLNVNYSIASHYKTEVFLVFLKTLKYIRINIKHYES